MKGDIQCLSSRTTPSESPGWPPERNSGQADLWVPANPETLTIMYGLVSDTLLMNQARAFLLLVRVL
jgi:hypothetical protein